MNHGTAYARASTCGSLVFATKNYTARWRLKKLEQDHETYVVDVLHIVFLWNNFSQKNVTNNIIQVNKITMEGMAERNQSTCGTFFFSGICTQISCFVANYFRLLLLYWKISRSCTRMSCYVLTFLSHLHTDVMLCYQRFSCICTDFLLRYWIRTSCDTVEFVLSFGTDVMPRYQRFCCVCTQTSRSAAEGSFALGHRFHAKLGWFFKESWAATHIHQVPNRDQAKPKNGQYFHAFSWSYFLPRGTAYLAFSCKIDISGLAHFNTNKIDHSVSCPVDLLTDRGRHSSPARDCPCTTKICSKGYELIQSIIHTCKSHRFIGWVNSVNMFSPNL